MAISLYIENEEEEEEEEEIPQFSLKTT